MTDLRTRGHRVLQALLIETRKATGLGQREFAVEMGVQKSVVERIEAGHQIPTYLEIRRWAIASGITPWSFHWRFEMRMKRHP